MAAIKRAVLTEALRENDAFQLALGAAIKLAYAELIDDVPEHVELHASDFTALVEVVVEEVRGAFRGDVTMLRVDEETTCGRANAIRVWSEA